MKYISCLLTIFLSLYINLSAAEVIDSATNAVRSNSIEPLDDLPNSLTGIISGTVVSVRGLGFRYVWPEEKNKFLLNIDDVVKGNGIVNFGTDLQNLTKLSQDIFKLVKVHKNENDSNAWLSFRAISQSVDHEKITMDVSRRPGYGNLAYVVIWMIIEYKDEVLGVIEVHGLTSEL